jgi:hypothetical protein
MSAEYDMEFDFLFNPTIHRPEHESVKKVRCAFRGVQPRNETQFQMLNKLKKRLIVGSQLPGFDPLPGVDPLLDQCVCYTIDQRAQDIRCLNGEEAFREVLFLFNVIIALEWNPDRFTFQQIRLSAMKASDFLYDVTNGYMAIGQVIIGGRDLMDMADIQIMASNRIHPRSWMAALNIKEKFKPIRAGRGIWQKNHNSLLTWDSPEGYRGLVHEWGHYAFGLVDEYLRRVALERNGGFWEESKRVVGEKQDTWEDNALDLAAPDVALPVESLMANTQISEYADLAKTFKAIQKYYQEAKDDTSRDGPDELALPLPRFLKLEVPPNPFSGPPLSQTALTPDEPEVVEIKVKKPIELARAKADPKNDKRQPGEAHWLYLLKGPFEKGLAQRVVAQGKIGVRDEDANAFRVLGAAKDDQVVFVSQVANVVTVLRATLESHPYNKAIWPHEPISWSDVTPGCLKVQTEPFFVDVIPTNELTAAAVGQPTQAHLCVQIDQVQGVYTPPTKVALYPSGGQKVVPLEWATAGKLTEAKPVPHLDGHVLLRWFDEKEAENGQPDKELFICTYSQGGGPNTSSGGILPVTGGSSDGNAMIFFNENAADYNPPKVSPDPAYDSTMRLVTTTLTVPPRNLAAKHEPRSYIFSLACNEQFDKGDGVNPPSHRAALVLYYDREALKHGSDLLIYRWKGAAWQRLDTFLRSDLPYVAVPIGNLTQGGALETAPNLTNDGVPLRVERYCILLTPPTPAVAAAPAPRTKARK